MRTSMAAKTTTDAAARRSIVTTAVATRGMDPGGPAGDRPHAPAIPHAVIGMILFVMAETMLFAGLISAFEIMRSSAMVWPPDGQPRLPIEGTALNTAALLASGFFFWRARAAYQRGDRGGMSRPMWLSLGLGCFFVLFQGVEWVLLIREGLTLTSSELGSFFYLIIGLHALHALGALGLMGYICVRLQRGFITPGLFGASLVLWAFVVGVWPVLYSVVYLR